MKFIEQLKTYKQQKQQSSENEKVINKLKENYQNKLNHKRSEIIEHKLASSDTVHINPTIVLSEKEQSTPTTVLNKKELSAPTPDDINDQTMLIDTKQLEDAQKKYNLDEKEITRPINNYVDYTEINKLKDNVLKAKQKYIDLTRRFIKDIAIAKE